MAFDLKNKVVKELRLSVVNHNVSPQIMSAKKGDNNSRYFKVRIYDERGDISLSDYDRVFFNVTLPDGSSQVNFGEIDATNRYAICKLDGSMLEHIGRAECDILLVGTDNSGEPTSLTTPTFYVNVLQQQQNDDAIEGDGDYTALQELLIEVEGYKLTAEACKEATEESKSATATCQEATEESKSATEACKEATEESKSAANRATEVADNIEQSTIQAVILNGEGEKSIVISEGEALGDHSIAGGATDKTMITEFVGLIGGLADLQPAQAIGDISLSFGANAKALAPGAISMGVNVVAGTKGYYWDSINFQENTIQLSTTRRVSTLKNPEYPSSIDWKVGDVVSIINESSYSCCSTITAVSGNVITVDALPFSQVKYESHLSLFDYGTPALPHARSIVNVTQPDKGVVVLGFGAIAMGGSADGATKALGMFSRASGYNAVTAGNFGVAMGRDVIAGYAALATGYNAKALGEESRAHGHNVTATGRCATALGGGTNAPGLRAMAGGYYTTAKGTNAFTYGSYVISNGESAAAFGANDGWDDTGVVVGKSDTTFVNKASVDGNASGQYSFTANQYNQASGKGASAFGGANWAVGPYSFATGYRNYIGTGANNSLVSGFRNTLNSKYGAAFGHMNEVTGGANTLGAFVTGAYNTMTGGNWSTIFGSHNTSTHNNCVTVGNYNITSANNQLVCGRYNKAAEEALLVVGHGASNETRANAFEVISNAVGVALKVGDTLLTEADLKKILTSIN